MLRARAFAGAAACAAAVLLVIEPGAVPVAGSHRGAGYPVRPGLLADLRQ